MDKKVNHNSTKYWAGFSISMLLLLAFAFFFIDRTISNDQERAELEVQQELQLLETLTSRLLQAGEYDAVQAIFNEWSENYPETISISLTTKNNYQIAAITGKAAGDNTRTGKKQIKYGYRGLATLEVTKNIDWVYKHLQEIVIYSAIVLLVLGAFGTYIVISLLTSQSETTRLKLLGKKLKLSNERANTKQHLLKSLIDSIPDLIFFKDRDSVYMGCNKAFEKYADHTELELIGKTDFDFFDKETATFFRSNDQLMMQSGKPRRNEEWVTYPDKHKVLLDTLKTPYYDSDGTLLGMIGISRDITEIKHFQRQLEELAYHDPLTHLPNRRFLIDRMNMAIAHADRFKNNLAVCTFDLDGFKEINDRLGHAAGDQVLIEFSNRLKNALRSEDTLARWGGDEFTVLFTNLRNIDECIELIERLQHLIAVPIEVNQQTFMLSASIGLTIYPEDKSDTDTLLRHADQAMYDAKLSGKNRYHVFDSEQNKLLHDHHENRTNIERAIINNEFVLYYQPQVHLRQGAPYGVEALVRWNHPERGIVGPGAFLPYIHDHLLSVELDYWVLETAISQLDQWLQDGKFFHMSINVSAITFQQNEFVDRLSEIFVAFPQVNPSMVSLELIETAALGNLELVAEKMKTCQKLGVQFSLDDFGTGYSSLTYLSRLPADVLKIDQSFVRDMLIDENDANIVEAIIRLASAFERMVIAEGVEEIMQGIKLIEMGCVYAQGYAIAKPMPAEKLYDWLSHFKPPEEWLKHKKPSLAVLNGNVTPFKPSENKDS